MGNKTSYIYLADQHDQPIPIQTLTGHRTAKLKKIFQSHLDRIQDDLEQPAQLNAASDAATERQRLAGEATLAWLYSNADARSVRNLAPLRPLRFHHVEVRMLPDKTLIRNDQQIAELP